MKNIDKKKKILLLCIIGCLLLTFSVSLAIFKYSKLGNNSSLVLGDIYMSSKEDSIVLNKLEPMSPNEGIEKGSKYNFSVEGYNTSNKNIYYGVYLNYGSEETGKTRFKDEDMMMYLTETKNGETKAVYGPGSVKDFNDKMIYASTIDSDTKKDEKIEINYELTVWLSDNILISDTEESYEGKNIYTTSEYENGYASIDVKVYGDFEEKNIKKASENITATTVSTGTSYEIKDDIKDSKEIDEDVKIVITTTKEAKLYLTNLETGLKEEKTLTLKNNLYTFEKIETDKSRYSYYFEYSDSTISQIYYYNINIKKYENVSKPTNVLCKSDIYNGNIQSLTNIDSTNAYELINNYQKDVGEYTVTAKLKSGFLWSDNSNSDVTFKCNITKKDLIIKPNTLSKNYLDADPTLTYTYSGNIEGETPKFSGTLTREAGEEVGTYLIKIGTLSINDNQEFKVSNYNLVFTKEEVKFSILEKTSDNLIYELEYSETTYDGLEKKPNITIKNGNKNLVNGTDYDITYKNNINVGNAVITIKFKGSYTGTSEKTFKINPKGVSIPTNSYCNTLTYNGASQTLTKTEGEGYTFSNTSGVNATSYTVTAKLKANYIWSDKTTTDKTFTCSIAKKNATISSADSSKTYDGESLTKTSGCQSATGLITNHTATCTNTGTITDFGTTSNILSSVVIKNGSVDVTNNYNITKQNGTLSISKRNVTYKADDATKVYDGESLTKNSATITSGTLVSGHTPIFTISGTITNVGTTTNTLSNVVIKNGSVDVTNNYNITKQNGTLTITSKSVSIPTNSYCNTLTYNGVSQTLTKTEGEGYTFSNTSGVNATSYTVTAKLKANYIWSDKTTTDKTFTCSIAKKSVAVTWNNPTLTYNGSDQAPTPSVSSDVTGETINLSKTTGKNAGNYTSTASCSSVTGGSATCNNYTLTNNTKSFTINKATATLNISSTSLTTTYGTNTSYTYTYSGDGTSFTCTSSNTAVATCSIDTTNKKVTITPVKVGTATITLSVSAGTNYNASSKVTNITINGITRTVTYTKGTGVSAISKTSDSCVTTGNATSCTVTLPTITAATGYTADGWYLDSTKVGSQSTTYTLTANRTLSAKTTVNVYTATFDTDVKIYNENTSSWTMHASTAIDNSSTYGNTTGVKVYSNTSKFTGLNIPIINFKQNTNYLLSVRAKKIGDFSGNLRVYATTYDSSNTVISYNHGITITSSNINTSNWTYFYYLFNSGSVSSMPKIQIDYDTASTGPVHISDIRLTEVRGLNISYGAQLGTLFSPTIKGYTYNGWYTGKNGSGTKISETTTMPAANTAYYAYYSPKTYTINYLANGGTGTMSATTATYATTISIKANAFTKSGYSFAGWTTKSDNTNDNYGWTNWSGVWIYDNGEYGVTNNTLNLYARWNPYYCATFNANGASSISKTSACCTATNGSSCTVTVPTITPKTNFEVLGWTDNASDLKTPTQLVYNDDGTLASITLTGNKTYYAVTKSTDDANKKYNIEFNLNGSDSYTISGVTYKQTSTFECQNQSVYNGVTIPTSCSYTLPTITRSGGTVYGWDKNDSNQGTPTYKVGQTISISDDISLSAITSRPITLSYDANGGTTTLTSQTAQVYNDEEGAWFDIPAYDNANMCRTKTNQFVGYKYVGLGTSSGSSVTSNCQGSKAYLTQNTTLYALWKTYYATASHKVSSGLIIRSSESTSASKVTTIPSGVKVYVTGPLGSCKSSHKWYPVIYGTYSGYSSAGASCSSTVNFTNFSYVADSSCSTSYACSGTNYNMTASPSKIVLNIKTGVLSQKITVDAQCGSYTFASSDTSVVTVASDGTVSTTSSAVAEGAQKTAKINITSAGGCTASVDVVVKNITETAPTVNVNISGTAQSSGYRSGATATVTCSSTEGIASFTPKDSKGGTFTITGDNYTKTATITLTGGSSGRTISATCKSNNDLSASASKTTKIYVYSASSACGVASYGYSGTCSCNTTVLYSKSCNSDIYNMGGCKAYCTNVYFTTGSGTCTKSTNYKSCYHT